MSIFTELWNWFSGLSEGGKVTLIAAVIGAVGVIIAALLQKSPKVTAKNGSIAAGSDIKGNNITLSNSIQKEEEK